MRFNRSLTTFIFILVLVSKTFSQEYDINVTIEGLNNADLFLGYHYGKKVYVIDTVKTNQQSNARFVGNDKLSGGMYLIYLPDKRYIDFLISDDQKMELKTNTSDLIGNMKIKGSKENTAFFDFQWFLADKYKIQSELRSGLSKEDITNEQKENLNIKLEELNKEVEKYWDKLIKKHQGTFVGNFIRSNREVKVPPVEKDYQLNDPMFAYNYLTEHFFDNIDLTDQRLLRTTVLSNRIEKYFERTLLQIPDSVISRVLWFIEKCRKSNNEVFRFIINDLINRYSQPKIMGMDAVYVSIAEKYYLSGIADWISNENYKMIEKRVSMIKPNLIGNIAPDLVLEDNKGTRKTLHEFNSKLTILLFWDHECSHCKETVNVLQNVIGKYSDKEVGIFAIYTMNNIESWKKFIKENNPNWTHTYDPKNITNFRNLYDAWGNPTIYILDKNKKIIAKKFEINQIKNIIERIIKSSTSSE